MMGDIPTAYKANMFSKNLLLIQTHWEIAIELVSGSYPLSRINKIKIGFLLSTRKNELAHPESKLEKTWLSQVFTPWVHEIIAK